MLGRKLGLRVAWQSSPSFTRHYSLLACCVVVLLSLFLTLYCSLFFSLEMGKEKGKISVGFGTYEKGGFEEEGNG